jgi:hypothetical protein
VSGQHCPGCRGHMPGMVIPCSGLALPDDDDVAPDPRITGFRMRIHHHLTRLPWSARVRVLLGLRVCTEIEIGSGPGEFADITDLVTGDGPGPDDLLGPGGPWRDQT